MNRRMTRKNYRRAFTLIELLVVLVILGVLAAIVVPKFTGRTEDAKIKAAIAQIGVFKTALGMFEVDYGRFPGGDEGLGVLVQPPANPQGVTRPYLEGNLPVDPWGHAYQYRAPSNRPGYSYDVYSLGPDGQESNDDILNN